MADEEDFREPHLQNADFLGAFGVLESAEGVLMVANERVICGARTQTWDLPGGQVEPGETVVAALVRELQEEVGIAVGAADTEFLFLQEGVRTKAGARQFVWRSFFFRVSAWQGTPRAQSEVLDHRWMQPGEFDALLQAPYHDSYLEWCRRGGTFFSSSWDD